jgi:nitrogen fixation/metabolism regulation signal transduction histidine kinase
LSRYKRFATTIIIIEILVILACNLLFLRNQASDSGRLYRVEAARVVRELQEKDATAIDLEKYATLLSVGEFVPEETCHNDYLVEQVGGKLYRIEYQATEQKKPLLIMNVGLGIVFILTLFMLVYVGKKVLKPFHNMTNLSYELAKGNLSTPIKEEKSKFFGRFLWGMDMLREKLEDNKEKELEFQHLKLDITKYLVILLKLVKVK